MHWKLCGNYQWQRQGKSRADLYFLKGNWLTFSSQTALLLKALLHVDCFTPPFSRWLSSFRFVLLVILCCFLRLQTTKSYNPNLLTPGTTPEPLAMSRGTKQHEIYEGMRRLYAPLIWQISVANPKKATCACATLFDPSNRQPIRKCDVSAPLLPRSCFNSTATPSGGDLICPIYIYTCNIATLCYPCLYPV